MVSSSIWVEIYNHNDSYTNVTVFIRKIYLDIFYYKENTSLFVFLMHSNSRDFPDKQVYFLYRGRQTIHCEKAF